MSDINVVIDISGLKGIAEKTEMAVSLAASRAVQATVVATRDEWIRQAQMKLRSTLPDYLLGLDVNSVQYPIGGDYLTGVVVLTGDWPVMLEEGFTAIDMKVNFAKSQRKKTTAKGKWYLTIPFRHGTPTSSMFGNRMTPDTYKKAKKLGDMESLPSAPGTQTSWKGYQHKNTIESGLTRVIKSYSNSKTGKTTNQSQYVSFRRVSENSDPKSWWHPGWVGAKIADTLEIYASNTFTEVFYAQF